MIANHGPGYSMIHKGVRRLKSFYTITRTKQGNWMVYNIHTQVGHELFQTKLRAYYEATVLNGTDVSKVFHFGDTIF